MANEFTGLGITFGFNTVGAPAVYTSLAGIASMDPPSAVAGDIEVSALDSTAKEFILDLPDAGECTITVNMRKATGGSAPWVASQTALEAFANDGVLHGFKITYPGATTLVYSFSGFVKQFTIGTTTPGAAVVGEVVIKVSGAITKV